MAIPKIIIMMQVTVTAFYVFESFFLAIYCNSYIAFIAYQENFSTFYDPHMDSRRRTLDA
jgi:hypothetical protein